MPEISITDEFIIEAQKFDGQRETEGSNRSAFIDKINRWIGESMGEPYCATGICYVLHLLESKFSIKFALPKTSSSRSFFMSSKTKYRKSAIKRGRIVVWESKTGGAFGHISFVISDIDSNNNFETFEFNTSFSSETLEGVGYKLRNKLTDPKFKVLGVVDISTAWKKI